MIVAGGRADGFEPSDIIRAITVATGLDGEAVRNVRVLERFVLLDVPAADAERVVELADRGDPRAARCELELARLLTT